MDLEKSHNLMLSKLCNFLVGLRQLFMGLDHIFLLF